MKNEIKGSTRTQKTRFTMFVVQMVLFKILPVEVIIFSHGGKIL